MQIKAAVLRQMGLPAPYTQSRPLEIREVSLAPPGPGEVRVRVVAAGLCHSDLSVINGDRQRPMPMVLGHEAAGIVDLPGEGVDDLETGDHVVLVFVPSCGHCLPCAEGRPALCEPGALANTRGTLLRGARRLRCDDADLNHHLGCSAFAEYCVVSRESVVKIDRDLPLDEAALFGCAVLTGAGAVVNTARLQAGQSAAVIGLGGVGLAALLAAAAAGASHLVAVDLSEDKLAVARALGATATVNARDPDAVEQIRDITHGGVDVALEMAGSAAAMDLSWRITRRGGLTVTAGLPPPSATLPVPLVSLVAEERTLKGSYVGGCVPSRDIPRFVALYRRGVFPVNKLISGRLPLENINEALDLLNEARAVRQLLII